MCTIAELRRIARSQVTGRFCEFIRSKPCENITGYLVGYSSEIAIIEEINWDCFRLNGFSLIWTKSLAKIHIFDESEWPIRAARELGVAKEVRAKFSKKPWLSMVKEFTGRSRLIQIEQERRLPGKLFLCEILDFTNRGLQVRSFARNLLDTEEVTIPFQAITKLTVLDGYSCAAEKSMVTRSPKVTP